MLKINVKPPKSQPSPNKFLAMPLVYSMSQQFELHPRVKQL